MFCALKPTSSPPDYELTPQLSTAVGVFMFCIWKSERGDLGVPSVKILPFLVRNPCSFSSTDGLNIRLKDDGSYNVEATPSGKSTLIA